MVIKKNTLIYLFLVFFFALLFRVAARTPIIAGLYLIEAACQVLLLFFFLFYVIKSLNNHLRFSSIEILVISFMFIPLLAAYSAYSTFRQPLIYGILAQRNFYFIISGLFLLSLLKKNVIKPEYVQKAFVTLAWASLILFSAMILTVNPEKYMDTELVRYSVAKGGYIFLFNVVFIIFGCIYYMIKYFATKKPSTLLCSAIFFLYLLVVRQDRTITLSTSAALFFFFLKNLSFRAKIRYSAYFIFLAAGMLLLLKILAPEFIDRNVEMYSNAFATFEGETTKEGSTNARLYETAIAVKYILKSPLLGNGDLSRQWNGGYERLFGYFFPSDVGIIGAVFIYGIIGTFLVNTQFLFAYKYIKVIQLLKNDVFFQSCKYFLLAYFLDSLTAGHTVFTAAGSILIIIIIYYYCIMEKKLQQEKLGVLRYAI